MPDGAAGIVKPTVGDPSDMLLDFIEKGEPVSEDTTVITSGSRSDRFESLFPRGIPIGRVTTVDAEERELYQRVHIEPFADLKRMDFVQVLTERGRRNRRRCCRDPRHLQRGPRGADDPGRRRLPDRRASSRSRCSAAAADIMPLLVAAVALYAGSVPGAATGFFTGLLLDLALGDEPGRLLARPDRGRLRRRPLPRAARPGATGSRRSR